MSAAEPVVELTDVCLDYVTPTRQVRALDGATLSVAPGETIGIVGESGSGKSTVASLLGRMLPDVAQVRSGAVRVAGRDVLDLQRPELIKLRREVLGFVWQDPIGSLDPTMRIGRQLSLVAGRGTPRAELIRMLTEVLIDEPERVLGLFPHQISGGMAQRITIAMAMARRPRVLIADEPTAALDTQVRNEVLALIFRLAAEQGTSVLWLSHDLRSVARWCSSVAVMYAGRVVETGPAAKVLADPVHPYTRALAGADPALARAGRDSRLVTIGGSPPVLELAATGCAFAERCPDVAAVCRTLRPIETLVASDRSSLCHLAEPALVGRDLS